VASGRQHYAVLHAIEGVLALHTLYYQDEVRTLDASWKRPAPVILPVVRERPWASWLRPAAPGGMPSPWRSPTATATG
jgi:hypothetical protein